jgi:hypothetical protein
MNAARFLMLTTAASTMIGCASARDRLLGAKPTAKAPSPNVEAVARKYNANSGKLQSIRCEAVTIDGEAKDPNDPNGKSQIYTLDAQLAFEKPSNFRMKGMFAARPEVDLGSNKDEIWCWVKRADPGAVYYCKRQDLGKMQMAIPFQPDWLAEVLGVTEINPSEFEWGGEKEDRYSLITSQMTPAGERAIKQMIFDRKRDRLTVIRLWTYHEPRRKLAEAIVEEYYEDAKTGLYCPRVVRLSWPDAGTKMKVMLGRRSIELNAITPEDGVALFSRGLSDKEPINMADPRLQQMHQEPTPVNQRSRSGYATPEPDARQRSQSKDEGVVDLGAPRAIGVRKASGDDSE